MSEVIALAVPGRWRDLFFTSEDLAELGTLGEVRVVEQHADLAADVGVLVTSWGTPVLETPFLEHAPNLGLVAHTGATVKPFVTDAVWDRGICVTQAGEGMAYAVGEAALAFTLALLHRIPVFDHGLHEGRDWADVKQAPPRHELAGSRVGVVGASRTGRHYIGLVLALGAEVVVYDPYLTVPEADRLGCRKVSLDELLAGSRVVAVHAPVLPETRHLLGPRELGLMPDGALLVNTARSWLVEQAALLAELRTGRIDAALDVYDEEPLPHEHPLRTLPNVLLTPHEAAGTRQARRRQGRITVQEIGRFMTGQPLEHEVRRDDLARMG